MDAIDTADAFGRLVRLRRQTLGLTQRELALAVNVGERFIVDLENGKPTCQLGKALAVAKGVGIQLGDISPTQFGNTQTNAPLEDAYPDLPDPGDLM